MGLQVSDIFQVLPKVRTQRSQRILRDLADDSDSTPDDGEFVSEKLEFKHQTGKI